jgi:hypothetical protein
MKGKTIHPVFIPVFGLAICATVVLAALILFLQYGGGESSVRPQPETAASTPSWAVRYPQLGFLTEWYTEADVVEGAPGKLFALAYNDVIESDYQLWFVDTTVNPNVRWTPDWGTLSPLGSSQTIEKSGDYVLSTMHRTSGEGNSPFYYEYYDPETGRLAYEVDYLEGGMSRTVTVNLQKDRIGTNFSITPHFSPPCDFENWSSPRQPTSFLGVDFSIDSAAYIEPKKFYPLPKPLVDISCKEIYDGMMGFEGPITSAGIEDGKIFFQMDFGTKITIDPNQAKPIPIFDNLITP